MVLFYNRGFPENKLSLTSSGWLKYVAQVNLKWLGIFLFEPSQCWDYGYELLSLQS